MKSAIVCCFLLVTAVGLSASDTAKLCSRQDAIRAEEEASSLQCWTEGYKSYKEFAQCDDGAIGEGYSDSIARLLSDKWGSADQLNRLVLHDKGFETFVLGHIDELMSPAQAERIRDNVNAHCPLHAKKLCQLIAARVGKVSAGMGSCPTNPH